MALYTVSTGTTVNANDINQFTNALAQPSGGSESQTIFVQIGAFQTNSTVSQWIASRSQGSAPVSTSVTATTSAGMNTISTSQANSSGASVGGGASGLSNTPHFATTVNFQY